MHLKKVKKNIKIVIKKVKKKVKIVRKKVKKLKKFLKSKINKIASQQKTHTPPQRFLYIRETKSWRWEGEE